jgi:hypothetical protein
MTKTVPGPAAAVFAKAEALFLPGSLADRSAPDLRGNRRFTPSPDKLFRMSAHA